jgi:hypothetical protein
MRTPPRMRSALPPRGELDAIDDAHGKAGHTGVDGGKPAHADNLMIVAIVALGVLMGYLAYRGWLPQAPW